MTLNPTAYPDYVAPEINSGSKYLLVAEAPGEVEVDTGRPLVGPTGQFVNSFLETIKLPRTWFDITNVVQHRPPNNNLTEWLDAEDERVELGRQALASLLASRKYDGILALGWFALLNLTGKRGIAEHRGSIYRLDWLNGTPVLGTYHPAILFEEPKLANVIFRDFFKFRKMVTEGVPEPPARNLVTYPTANDFQDFFHRGSDKTWVSVDIEAHPKTKELTEVGFAWSATDAICVKMGEPWTYQYVEHFLQTEYAKVFHNASFDVPFLEYNLGWEVNGDLHDTLLMHHTIYPEFPADLGFCASIWTDEPYWKDLGKQNDEALRQRYNALDVAVTAELFVTLGKKLDSLGLRSTYERDRAVIRPAIDMSKRGINYDFDEHERLRSKMDLERSRWQRVLNERARRACIARDNDKAKWLLTKLEKGDLNVMSPLQAPALLYDVLGLPVQHQKDKKKGKKRATTSQMKLLNLYPNITDRATKKTLRALLNVRRVRKMLSTYLREEPLTGPDDRIRTSFGVGRTETGRWTASEFLIDQEGANLQTVPPEWKSCFISDPGMDLFYADYSQIEARIVAYDAEDLDQIKVFESGGDIHRENAARMTKKPVAEVTDDERQYMGKTVHALNYKVGAETLAESINKHGLETGIFISKDFTRSVRSMYLNTYDKVVRWQRRQWATVKETGILVNHLGRRRLFTGPKKGQFAHITEGECIAFVPQSDVPDLLNLAILAISKDKVLQDCNVQLLLQVHDALFGQGDADKKHIWVPRIRELMTIPLTIRGRQCIVPVDIKVGKSWKSLSKYKEG